MTRTVISCMQTRQLIPKSYYEQHFERKEDNRAIKFRKMLDGAKKKLNL